MTIRVVVIEDEAPDRELICRNIKDVLGFECVGAFVSYDAAALELEKLSPDVVLLDLGLPGTPGVIAARHISEKWPAVKILVFTSNQSEKTVLSLLAAGADGYVLKDEPRHQLEQHIRAVFSNSDPMALSPQIVRVLANVAQQRLHQLLPEAVLRSLSPLEEKLLDGFDRGADYKKTCGEFDIATGTLKTHVARIFEKCLAHSTGQAAYHRRLTAF